MRVSQACKTCETFAWSPFQGWMIFFPLPTPSCVEGYLKHIAFSLSNEQRVRCAAAELGWGAFGSYLRTESEGLGDALSRLAKFWNSCINAGPHYKNEIIWSIPFKRKQQMFLYISVAIGAVQSLEWSEWIWDCCCLLLLSFLFYYAVRTLSRVFMYCFLTRPSERVRSYFLPLRLKIVWLCSV